MPNIHDPLARLACIKNVESIFASVLGTNIPKTVFDNQEITFSDDGKRMYEHTSSCKLAEAVLAADFPRNTSSVYLDHFTSLQGFRGIIQSGSLFLTSLTKRLHEDEFTTFMTEHGLGGYSDNDPDTGRPIFEELSNDLFYCSMTEPNNPDEKELWETFADNSKGVRLRLRVTPKAADMRQVGYQGNGPTALKQINDKLNAQEQLTYTPWTISRICAFYLTFGYRHEREIRIMIKRHQGGPDHTRSHNGFSVWPVPLAAPGSSTGDNWCEIELIEVTTGRNCNASAVQTALNGSPYSSVPISTVP